MAVTPLEIASRFQLIGRPVSAEPYGTGTINDTYCVVCEPYRRYILQRINRTVFPDIPCLMANMHAVLAFLQRQFSKLGMDPLSHCLMLVAPKSGGTDYIRIEDGECWRMFFFIEDTFAIPRIEDPQHGYAAGYAFGFFQHLLADFPVTSLFDVLPHFHDTQKRLIQLEEAVAADPVGRLPEVEKELAFIRERRHLAPLITSRLQSGELPMRITHNDTRIDNILFDCKTEQPRAVIDLDTIMIGSALYDFGDSIRSGCNPTDEDETDLSKVRCDLRLFEAYTTGFLKGCSGTLTDAELSLLPESALLLAFECAVRFLTDYLSGDIYFKIDYASQNLNRCRNQLTLVKDIEKKLPDMHAIVRRIGV